MLILRVGSAPIERGNDESAVLRKRGINVEHAASGPEALDFIRLYEYDLILMDLVLPGLNGDEVVRQARAGGLNTPIVMLANAAPTQTRIKALDQGVDDFVTTPCEIEELLARIRAVVRRGLGHSQSVLQAGCVELSLDKREVRVQGQKLPISRREFGVLELLFLKLISKTRPKRPLSTRCCLIRQTQMPSITLGFLPSNETGTILNKTAFLNHLYSGLEEPEMKTIDVIICRLRKKLTRAGIGTLIDTIWGCGYTLRVPMMPDFDSASDSTSDDGNLDHNPGERSLELVA